MNFPRVAVYLALRSAFAIFSITCDANGAPPIDDDSSVSRNAIQTSLLQGLSSLHSGEFTGTWVERFVSPDEGEKEFSFSGEIRGKFDDAIKCYAIQRSVWVGGSKGAAPGESDYGLILLPTGAIRHGETSKIITICNTDGDPGRSPQPSGAYFDPRSVGVLWWGEIFKGAAINANRIAKSFGREPTSVVNELLC